MAIQFFHPDQVVAAARSSLRPRLLITAAISIVGAVLIYGLFRIVSPAHGLGSILIHFAGGIASLLWLMFGLTALAHQVHCSMRGEDIPLLKQAACFAWERARSLLMLPVWGVGLLVGVLLAEMALVALANLPGIGALLLALLAVPLLIVNTVIALALLLAVFNMAARIALGGTDPAELRDKLWTLLRTRLPELLIYNLGGVLATVLAAGLLLSPLWLGFVFTESIVGFVAPETADAVMAASGFWGGIAHLVGLVMLGVLLAAVASIPLIVITHLTLGIHIELDAPAAKPRRRRAASASRRRTSTSRKRTTARAAASPSADEKTSEDSGTENTGDSGEKDAG